LIAIGKKANRNRMITFAVVSNPAHSTISGTSATLGVE